MARRFEGKVALVSGAARGQGRSHALRFAEEGADVVAFDVCRQFPSVPFPMATPEDLQETVRLVEKAGGRIIARELDSRDADGLAALVSDTISEFGRLDAVVANAGIATIVGDAWTIPQDDWDEMISTNLTGVWQTAKATIPAMIEAGNGGSIVLTSSGAALRAGGNLAHYVAAKWGVVGLSRALAIEAGKHRIRVNAVHPGGVNTPMTNNEHFMGFFRDHPEAGRGGTVLPDVWMVEPEDISGAVLYLCSDDARYVTGISLSVDAGASI